MSNSRFFNGGSDGQAKKPNSEASTNSRPNQSTGLLSSGAGSSRPSYGSVRDTGAPQHLSDQPVEVTDNKCSIS